MANIRVTCPTCKADLEISKEHLGKEVECGSCLQAFVAEDPKSKKKPYKMRRPKNEDRDDDDRSRKRRPRRDDDEEDDYDYSPRRYSGGVPPKSRLAYILLAFFIGGLGIHNFYVGRTGPGIGQLSLALFNITMIVLGGCTFGITWILAGVGLLAKFIWVVLDMIVVTKDGEGRPACFFTRDSC